MDDIIITPPDYKSSSKFAHDPLTEALWLESLDSSQDEEAGTTDTIGWYALFHFPERERIEIQDGAPLTDRTTVIVPIGSYILEQQDSGAVYVTRYSLRGSEVSEDWRKILAAESDAWDGYLDDLDPEPNDQ